MKTRMKNDTAILTVKTGVFFSNADGNYDKREREFISRFINSLKSEDESITEDTIKVLEKSIDEKYSIQYIVTETRKLLDHFNAAEQKLLIDKLLEFIKGVIMADGIEREEEKKFLDEWMSAFC